MLGVTALVVIATVRELASANGEAVLGRAAVLCAGIILGWLATQAYFIVTARLVERWKLLGYVVAGSFIFVPWTAAALLPNALYLGGMLGLLASWFPHCWEAVGVEDIESADRQPTSSLDTKSPDRSKPAA
jgi:hypothetical protein